MSNTKKTALISTLFTQAHGGVYTMLGLVVGLLKERGFDVKIAYYMPYSQDSRLSVPIKKLFRAEPTAFHFQGDFGVEEYAIGATLPEFEFTHYYPHAEWKKLINSTDYHFVVSGPILAALPFYVTKKKFIAWVASPYHEDRKDRVKLFPWYRKCFDYVFASKISRYFEKKLLRSGTVLALSNYTKHKFGDDQKWIQDIMSMPISEADYYPDENKNRPWSICFTARFLDPRKNVFLLLEAFSLVLKQNAQARLVLIGDDSSDALKKRLDELNIAPNVDILNYIKKSELLEKLQQTDVFVIPSFQEGLCISGLEAMACGCPVVSTDCGGPSDYIFNDKNGYLVDFTATAMAEKIIRICSDRALRNKLSHNAIETIKTNYSVEKMRSVFNRQIDKVFLSNKQRVLYVVSHPIQYQAPLLRLISQSTDIDITALFYWDKPVEAQFDEGFGCKIEWDVPLLSGYKYAYLNELAGSTTRFNKIKTLWKLLSSKQYDSVWTHGYTDLFTALTILFAKLKGLKVFVRGESMLFANESPSFKRKLFFKFFDRVINGYLAIGTNNKTFYLKNGISEDKISLCHYAVDNHFFRENYLKSKNRLSDLRKNLNIDENRPVILYASKFITRKYPIDLLQAYQLLCERTQSPKPYLLFIGTGETLEAVKAQAQFDQESIRFLGFKNQSELPNYYALADILVLPSMRENWGLIVNEAMNADCAIIVSDQVGCATDLVKPGVNGYIYPARDVNALSQYLQILVEDRALCETMKINSHEIISHWGLPETVNGLRDALNKKNNELKSLLIFRLGSVGDTVVALPTFRLIKKAFPDAKKCVLTNLPVNNKACAVELILENTGLVDQFIEYPSKSSLLKKAISLRKLIKKSNFSTMIYMHQNRNLLNAWRDFLFFKFCGIKKIIGLSLFIHGFQYRYDHNTKLYESEHRRLARQLKSLGAVDWQDPKIIDLALTQEELQQARSFVPENILHKPFFVCSIGTKLAMKDWGQDNWKLFISKLSQHFSNYGMIFIGVQEEYERSDELLRFWQGSRLNLCGKLSVRQSAALLSYARLFIGHDSGPMHLSAAVGTPSVAVFSRHSNPGCWYPYGTAEHINIYPTGKTIHDITVNEVLKSTVSLLLLPENKEVKLECQ